jgi:hypothetical protein
MKCEIDETDRDMRRRDKYREIKIGIDREREKYILVSKE